MRLFKIALLLLTSNLTFAQSSVDIDRWDNWLLLGNKVVFGGKNDIIHSHELQWRVNNNMRELKEWFYEGVFTYTPNKYWEIVPDFRATIKPDRNDFRFGLGLVRKDLLSQNEGQPTGQLVQQLKYQMDIDSHGDVRHGVRFVATYSRIISEKFIISGLFGPFYRWSKSFNGIEFVRGGPVFTYVFDPAHTLAIAPLFGAANLGKDGWAYSFTPFIQFIIRINDDYKYVPAKYINF